MGRKRKGGGAPFGQDDYVRSRPNDEARLAINTYEDVPDSEDEFMIHRDKILLEEAPAEKKLRLAREEDALLEPSDEEVLAVSEEDNTSESEDQEEEDYDDDFENTEDWDESQESISVKTSKKLGKPLAASESEDEGAPLEDEDAGGWGSTKKDYYNADPIETREDAEEEEKEALRLQRKQLEGMTEADFGLNEDVLEAIEKENEALERVAMGSVVTQKLPTVEITGEMGPEERMRHLRAQYPEFEPLAKEFVELQGTYDELMAKSQNLSTQLTFESIPNVNLKYRTLAAYLSALAMYFALLTSPAREPGGKPSAMAPDEIQRHSIMDTLLQCRELWQKIKDLNEPEIPASEVNGQNDTDQHQQFAVPSQTTSTDAHIESPQTKKPKQSRKSKYQKALEARSAAMEADRQARLRKTEESLASLSALASKPPQKASTSTSQPRNQETAYASDSDLGEPTALTSTEAADKAAARKKKSLKFYTSQIAQKSTRRSTAGREAGGDDDIPYRDRKKDRMEQISTTKTADARGADLGGESSGDDPVANNARINGTTSAKHQSGGEEEDYYDFIAAQSARKKASKAAAAASSKVDGSRTIKPAFGADALDGDSKRPIGYTISKNKGLHAPRKKEVRNPRVKKRKRYEDKTKKLRGSGQRAVWKGGEGKGGYGGETTGIKKGVSRGVRL